MAKIQIQTAIEMFNLGNIFIAQTKEKIVTKLAQSAVQNIQKESNGKHQANLRYKPGGFQIVEPKTAEDPTGEKAQETERQTKAYKKTYDLLSDETIVAGIVRR